MTAAQLGLFDEAPPESTTPPLYRFARCAACGGAIGDTVHPRHSHLTAEWMHVDRANDDHHPRLPREVQS